MSTLRQPGGWPVSKHTITSSNPYIIFVIRTHRKMEHSYRDFFFRSRMNTSSQQECLLFVYLNYILCCIYTAVSGCYTRVIAYYDPINRCITALFMSVFINMASKRVSQGYSRLCRITLHCITCTLHYYYQSTIKLTNSRSRFSYKLCYS